MKVELLYLIIETRDDRLLPSIQHNLNNEDQMNQESLDIVGRALAVELGLKLNKCKQYSLPGGAKSNEGLLRTVVRIINEQGIKVEIPEETEQPKVLKLSGNIVTIPITKTETRALPEFFVTPDSISYTERGFFIGFANKHVAKDAMNEILHAFDGAGMDKSNLVGDVLFGISEQLDGAFGNEDWDDEDVVFETNKEYEG